MKNFFLKNSFLLLLVLLIICMLGVYWFGIRMLQEQVSVRRDKIQEIHATRENRDQQLSRLPELRKQYDAIVKEERHLDILYTDDRIVDFIRTLEDTAILTGTEVVITSPSNKAAIETKGNESTSARPKGENSGPLLRDEIPFDRYLTLSLEVTGEYPNIVQFLHKLETLPVALDVMKIKVSEDTAEEERPTSIQSNPFLMAPGDAVSAQASVTEEDRVVQKKLKAVFETLLYLDEKNTDI